MCIPPEYGGAGMDYISLGIASEEVEYVDTSLGVVMSVHVALNSLTLLTWGTEDQRTRYLVPQAQGQKIASYALTEPGAGSDVRAIQTVAVKKGDRYVLTGEKTWISLADVADNFLVFAWTDQEKKKTRDISGIDAFIVERGFSGFSSGPCGKSGASWRAIPAFSRWTRSRCLRRTWWAGLAKASRSRCSRWIKVGSRSPPVRPD